MARQKRKSISDLGGQADRLIMQTNDGARRDKILNILRRYSNNIRKTERWRKVNTTQAEYYPSGKFNASNDRNIANGKRFGRSTYMGLSKG